MMCCVKDADAGGNPKAPPSLGLVIAWGSPLVRAAMVALIERLGHRTLAEVDNWPALASTPGMVPAADLAIIDIDLVPRMAGRLPGLPMVVVAPTASHPGIGGVIEGAAAGLVLGSEGTDSLQLCLATVAAGSRWFDRTALDQASQHNQARKDGGLLTRRERDVARLVAGGHRNRAIAGSLGISEGTVKMHLHNVYAKMGLQSRTQLAMDERLRLYG